MASCSSPAFRMQSHTATAMEQAMFNKGNAGNKLGHKGGSETHNLKMVAF